jgi:hypothetical protein
MKTKVGTKLGCYIKQGWNFISKPNARLLDYLRVGTFLNLPFLTPVLVIIRVLLGGVYGNLDKCYFVVIGR